MAQAQRKSPTASTGRNARAALLAEYSTPSQVEEPDYADARSERRNSVSSQVEELEFTDARSDNGEETQESAVPEQQAEDCKEVAFIQVQLGRVPFVGKYVGSLLRIPYVLPITQKLDPFVEAGAQRVAPHVEGLLARAQQVPVVIQAVPGQLYQGAMQAPGHAMQSIRAMPQRVYQTSVHATSSIVQKGRAFPDQAYNAAKFTAASMVDRASAVSTQMSQNIRTVSGKVVENMKATASNTLERGKHVYETIKVAPAKMAQWSKGFLEKVLKNMRAAPSLVYDTTRNSIACLVENITTASQKTCDKAFGIALSGAEALDNATQPFVHRIVKVVAPRAESVAKNQYVQSIYQHRFVQACIEKATPYASKVAEHPTILDFTNHVMLWALPSM